MLICSLPLLAPPKFLKEIDETITLKVGASTAIEIPFSAYPMPKVQWRFNGGKLPDPRRFKPETIIGMTSMTIAKVVRKDSGQYTLALENEHGKCDCKFTLVVLGRLLHPISWKLQFSVICHLPASAYKCMLCSVSDKPGPPVDLRVADMNETSIALAWQIPEDDGGSPITKYIVEQRESGKRAWQPAGKCNETTFTVENLTEGQTYMFRVAAENDVGRGDFAELTQAVAPKSQFGK